MLTRLDMLRDCVHADVGLIFSLQNLSYELPILSFVSFGLKSTFLHGFSHQTLFELRPLRLQLHLKYIPKQFAILRSEIQCASHSKCSGHIQ